MLDIGEQIKKLREEKRITGKDLARRIGLSQSQMSRLEKGQRRIDTEVLARIADALDVSPACFFGEPPTGSLAFLLRGPFSSFRFETDRWSIIDGQLATAPPTSIARLRMSHY